MPGVRADHDQRRCPARIRRAQPRRESRRRTSDDRGVHPGGTGAKWPPQPRRAEPEGTGESGSQGRKVTGFERTGEFRTVGGLGVTRDPVPDPGDEIAIRLNHGGRVGFGGRVDCVGRVDRVGWVDHSPRRARSEPGDDRGEQRAHPLGGGGTGGQHLTVVERRAAHTGREVGHQRQGEHVGAFGPGHDRLVDG